MIKSILKDNLFISLSVFFAIMALSYPVTITFDSGHYMFLADIIRDGTWSEWDPIRGIVFPLFLYLTTSLLGRNVNALLLPMIFSQVILFLFAIYFILQATGITKTLHRKLIIVLVFIVLMLDPLVFGYYHTLLTEFFATILVVVSIYISYKFYRFSESLPTLSKPFMVSFLYFFLAVPFAWHLKQPYIGTALFPFLLSCFLIMTRDFRKKRVLLYITFANISVIVSLISSIFLWAGFLHSVGMPAKPDRELSDFFNRAYEAQADTAFDTPIIFSKYVVKKYLASSNFYYFDRGNYTIVKEESLVRAFQNQAIAFRMYDLYGQSSVFPMTSKLQRHVDFFSSNYYPPLWFNLAQIVREKISNFLFTITYLLVPLIFFPSIAYLLKKKNLTYFFVVIGSGAAFFNAVAHAIFILPLDRYLFWGYPLNLIVIIILTIKAVQKNMMFEFSRKKKYPMPG